MNIDKIALLLGPIVAFHAHAEIYMTDADAVKKIFPGNSFDRASISLSALEAASIEKLAHETVRNKTVVVWRNGKKDCVFIDQVLGKHEFITYAVGVSADGTVKGIEILEYRESYGHQVKSESWRKQFVGKVKTGKFKLDDDIKNLSGATLSSSHITGGVKRILFTYDAIKEKL